MKYWLAAGSGARKWAQKPFLYHTTNSQKIQPLVPLRGICSAGNVCLCRERRKEKRNLGTVLWRSIGLKK